MTDLLPYLRLEGKTSEEKIGEIVKYLIQVKEILEFELAEISSSKVKEIETSVNSEEQISQLVNKIGVKTSSEDVKNAINDETSNIISAVFESEDFKTNVKNEINNDIKNIINAVCESQEFENKVKTIDLHNPG